MRSYTLILRFKGKECKLKQRDQKLKEVKTQQ